MAAKTAMPAGAVTQLDQRDGPPARREASRAGQQEAHQALRQVAALLERARLTRPPVDLTLDAGWMR